MYNAPMLRTFFIAIGMISIAASALAQENSNPLVQVLHAQSKQGISPKNVLEDSPVNFKRSTARKGVETFLKEFFENEDDRKA